MSSEHGMADPEGAAPTPSGSAPANPSAPKVAPSSEPTQETALWDGHWRQRDPRHMRLSQSVNLSAAGLLCLALAAIALAATQILPDRLSWLRLALPSGLWLLFAVISFALAYRWPVLEHRHCRYRLDAEGIEIQSGVLWRTLVNIPRSRIQHTDLNQGPFERQLDLASLTIHTAGVRHATVAIAGLSRAQAVRIRDHLITPTAFEPVDDPQA